MMDHPEGRAFMTAAARSMNVFALYLLGLSVALLVAPNVLLQLFGLPTTEEVWIRVVGMLVAFLGLYYRVAAAATFVPMFRLSVLVRFSVVAFFAVFVAAGWVAWPLILFGVVDAAGAAWTWSALRQDAR
jgi:hypothetical protein